MPMITLGEEGRLTVPGVLRRELHLTPGDILEATVDRGRLVMVPKEIIDKGVLVEKMWHAFSELIQGRFAEMSEEEIAEEASRIVDEDRFENQAS